MVDTPERQSDLPSPAALAYLGDAVFSHYVRRHLVSLGITRAEELNRRSLAFVTAERQAALYLALEGELTDFERDLARRASNSGHLSRPRHVRGVDYRRATALEAILGMCDMLGDEERILYIVSRAVALSDAAD